MRKGKRRRRSDGGGSGGGDEGGCPRVLSNWNTTSGNPRRPLNGQRKRVCTTVEEATAGSLAQPHTDAVFSNAARAAAPRASTNAPCADPLARGALDALSLLSSHVDL